MKRYFVFIVVSIIFLLGLAIYQYVYYYDNKLHVIFCNVGQGDAILIKTPGNRHLLVDGGPDKSVLTCLSKNMPFWERTIDLMILTHPHKDHFSGLTDVIDRYITLYFVSEKLGNKASSFVQFTDKVKEKVIAQRRVLKGDRYRLGEGVVLTIEAPSLEALRRSSPNGMIGESSELASLVMKLSYKDFDVLLTGDTQTEALREVAERYQDRIEVLQVPHHGSRTGLSSEIVDLISAKLAVISVGANNTYGHPSKEVLSLLREAGVRTWRTDQRGDIEIISDGKGFMVR